MMLLIHTSYKRVVDNDNAEKLLPYYVTGKKNPIQNNTCHRQFRQENGPHTNLPRATPGRSLCSLQIVNGVQKMC